MEIKKYKKKKKKIDYNRHRSPHVLEEIDSHVKTKHENSIIVNIIATITIKAFRILEILTLNIYII